MRPQRGLLREAGLGANPVLTTSAYLVQKREFSSQVSAPPPPGNCHSSVLYPAGLPHITCRIIWDGSAEGTSISDRCLSRLLRAQEEAQGDGRSSGPP